MSALPAQPLQQPYGPEWRGTDDPPEEFHKAYYVRLAGGQELVALYWSSTDWRAWDGEDLSDPLDAIAWRPLRHAERNAAENDSHAWKEASRTAPRGTTVWVLWEDQTQSLGRFLPDMGGWWQLEASGPMAPSPVKAVAWREVLPEDSGHLVLSQDLRRWARLEEVDFAKFR